MKIQYCNDIMILLSSHVFTIYYLYTISADCLALLRIILYMEYNTCAT